MNMTQTTTSSLRNRAATVQWCRHDKCKEHKLTVTISNTALAKCHRAIRKNYPTSPTTKICWTRCYHSLNLLKRHLMTPLTLLLFSPRLRQSKTEHSIAVFFRCTYFVTSLPATSVLIMEWGSEKPSYIGTAWVTPSPASSTTPVVFPAAYLRKTRLALFSRVRCAFNARSAAQCLQKVFERCRKTLTVRFSHTYNIIARKKLAMCSPKLARCCSPRASLLKCWVSWRCEQVTKKLPMQFVPLCFAIILSVGSFLKKKTVASCWCLISVKDISKSLCAD